MDSFFDSAICMCWLIPFGGTVVMVILSHGIHQTWRQRRVPDSFPHCGGCGYNLRGVSKLRCPECGKPLHVNTVMFRGDRQPLPLSGRLLMWTSFLPGPMLLFYMLFAFLWPAMYESTWTASLRFTAGNQTVNAVIEVDEGSFHKPARLETFNVLLANSKPSPRHWYELNIDLDDRSMSWQTDDPNGDVQNGPLNTDTLVKMLDASGLLDEQIDARPAFANTLLDVIYFCEKDQTTEGRYDGENRQGSWTVSHLATRTGKDTGNVLAIVITFFVGGAFWVWGMSRLTQHYEGDWERYTQVRQQIYSRFRDHVKADAADHDG